MAGVKFYHLCLVRRAAKKREETESQNTQSQPKHEGSDHRCTRVLKYVSFDKISSQLRSLTAYDPNRRYSFVLSKATALDDKRARGRIIFPQCYHTNSLTPPLANVFLITGKSFSTDHDGNSRKVKFSLGQNELSHS